MTFPLLLIAVGLTLLACATPYQERGFRGGYSDFKPADDTHFVIFEGNRYTGRARVVEYWHRRAAEICGGRESYEILSSENTTNDEVVGEGWIHSLPRPAQEGYIRCMGKGAEIEAPITAPR